MSTPKQKLKALKLTRASADGNSRGCEIGSLPYAQPLAHADELLNSRHKGWFTDADGDGETYRGAVWELSDDADTRDPIFLAGYDENSGDYVCLSCTRGKLDTFDSARDAAHAADALAERNAEREREYSDRWQAASACADDIETMRDDAARERATWRELMRAGTDKARELADNARAEHAGIIAAIIGKRERIADLGMAGEF